MPSPELRSERKPECVRKGRRVYFGCTIDDLITPHFGTAQHRLKDRKHHPRIIPPPPGLPENPAHPPLNTHADCKAHGYHQADSPYSHEHAHAPRVRPLP